MTGQAFGWETGLLAARLGALAGLVPLLVLLRRRSPVYFDAFARDFRWLRLLHYELMFALGLALETGTSLLDLPTVDLAGALLVVPALAAASLFAIVTNNLADREIDRIANPDRPLFRDDIDAAAYRRTAPRFLFAALLLAALSGPAGLLGVTVITALYTGYSLPPVRFKRIPVLSKLVVSAGSLAVVATGFVIKGGDLRDLPLSVVALFLVGVTGMASFIDLKDVEGDRAGGIRTLPVLLGTRRARVLLGLCFGATYVGVCLLLKDPIATAPVLLLGAAQIYYLTFRQPYSERPVFLLHLVNLAGLVLYLGLFSPFPSP